MLLVFIGRFNYAKFHSIAVLSRPSIQRISLELVLPFFLSLRVYSWHANRRVSLENPAIHLFNLFVVILGNLLDISNKEVLVDRRDIVRVDWVLSARHNIRNHFQNGLFWLDRLQKVNAEQCTNQWVENLTGDALAFPNRDLLGHFVLNKFMHFFYLLIAGWYLIIFVFFYFFRYLFQDLDLLSGSSISFGHD